MPANPLAKSISAKKLSLLLYDARLASRRSPADCAAVLNLSEEAYLAYEQGLQSPSLPELEVLAFSFNIPLDHFWSRELLSTKAAAREISNRVQFKNLRQRMIGATLRKMRLDANLTALQVAEEAAILETDLRAYELGECPIPLPILEQIISALHSHLDQLFDLRGPVGRWRSQQESIEDFMKLSPELQDFVSRPVNQPYLELAHKLSEFSAEKLRAIAESLLDITY